MSPEKTLIYNKLWNLTHGVDEEPLEEIQNEEV